MSLAEHQSPAPQAAELVKPAAPPRMSRRERLRAYRSLFRRSTHIRYSLANLVCAPFPDFVSGIIRARIYRLAGFDIDKRAFLMGNLRLTGASSSFYDNLVIAEDALVADGVTINLDGRVTIEANAAVSPQVLIYTGSHKMGPGSWRLGPVTSLPVTIEQGAWVRLGAIIVPGVTIGRGAVVAAGAVVLKDVPPNTYVEGNPAQVKRKLPWGYR